MSLTFFLNFFNYNCSMRSSFFLYIFTVTDFLRERLEMNVREKRRAESAIRSRWTNDFFLNEPTIAPLRGALSVWGLDVNDIAVASFHGTGTSANDVNESKVTHLQMQHLGRT